MVSNLLLLPRSIAPVAKPPEWLRGDWRFSAGAGSKLFDHSRYRNHGTITGATWTTVSGKRALDFAGGTHVVTIPHVASLLIPSEVTMELILQLDSFAVTYNTCFQKGATTYPWYFTIRSNGGIDFWTSTAVGDNTLSTATGVISTDTKYHIVCTYKTGVKAVYVDGVEKKSTALATGDFITNTESLYLGRSHSASYRMDGKIFLARLLSKYLEPSEVVARYNALG